MTSVTFAGSKICTGALDETIRNQMSKIPMTKVGELALREELQRLKQIERPRIVLAIAEAREHGDLKENAEYHAAESSKGSVREE